MSAEETSAALDVGVTHLNSDTDGEISPKQLQNASEHKVFCLHLSNTSKQTLLFRKTFEREFVRMSNRKQRIFSWKNFVHHVLPHYTQINKKQSAYSKSWECEHCTEVNSATHVLCKKCFKVTVSFFYTFTHYFFTVNLQDVCFVN